MIPLPARQRIVEKLSDIHKDCTSLMETANEFAKSKDPIIRALAYEIGVAVSKITAEGKIILKQLNETEEVCEENGFGALAE